MALLLLHTACALDPTTPSTVHRDVSAMETAALGAAAHIPGVAVLNELTKHGRGLRSGCEIRCDNAGMCGCPVPSGSFGGEGWCMTADGTDAMRGRSQPDSPTCDLCEGRPCYCDVCCNDEGEPVDVCCAPDVCPPAPPPAKEPKPVRAGIPIFPIMNGAICVLCIAGCIYLLRGHSLRRGPPPPLPRQARLRQETRPRRHQVQQVPPAGGYLSRTTSRQSAWRRSTRTPRTSPTASSASSSAR